MFASAVNLFAPAHLSNPSPVMMPAPPQPTTAQNAFLQLQNLLLQQQYQQQQRQQIYFAPSQPQAAPGLSSVAASPFPFPQLFLQAPQPTPVAPISSYVTQQHKQGGSISSQSTPGSRNDRSRRQAREARRESRRRQDSSRKRKRSQYENDMKHEDTDQFESVPASALQLPFDLIVVDTNQLILNLGHLSSLQKYDEKINLIVPVTVVNELDHMKTQNRDPELRTKAQQAISFLNAQFKQEQNKACWIKLQTRDHVFNVAHGGAAAGYKENNDDRILDCALYYQHADPTLKLALLTEDKNLSLKARCSSLQVVDCRTLLSKLPSVSLWKRRKLNAASTSNSSDSEVSSSNSDDSDSEMKSISNKNKNTLMNTSENKNNDSAGKNTTQTENDDSNSQNQSLSPLSLNSLSNVLLASGVMRHLAPRDLLAMQAVNRRFGSIVADDFDWSDRLRKWSGDAQGKMIPAEPAEAKKWYIKWRRTIVPPQ